MYLTLTELPDLSVDKGTDRAFKAKKSYSHCTKVLRKISLSHHDFFLTPATYIFNEVRN